MSCTALERLTSDEFLLQLGVISNSPAVYRKLASSEEVQAVRDALSLGQIDDWTIRRFVSRLLDDFQSGCLFPYDLTIAALAVVMATRPTVFAEEFLLDLAKLQLRELPFAIRVARYAASVHAQLARNKSAVYSLLRASDVPDHWEEAARFGQEPAAQRKMVLEYGAA